MTKAIPNERGRSLGSREFAGKLAAWQDQGAAEVAFVIRDEWQNLGVGTFLFRHLQHIAMASGITGFTAEVLRNNRRMQAIFNHSGLKVKTSIEEDVFSYIMDF